MRIRTAVAAFAELCLTPRPRDHHTEPTRSGRAKIGGSPQPGKTHLWIFNTLPDPYPSYMIRTAILSLIALPFNSFAQCPGCSPDLECAISPPYPTTCPQTLPPATAGQAYEADITFWLPPEFQDPGSGLEVSFQQMTINNIAGLPFGLDVETSSANGVYLPQEDPYGCARVCGTPIAAGTFPITISITASVEASGFPVNVEQQFVLDLLVEPGAGSNNGFTFSPAVNCGPTEVTFQATIDAAPQPTSWLWDFGNGQQSTLASPPVQTYDEPGTYAVTLQTTISGHMLQSVTISSVNGAWCGDVEEPLCNCGTPIIGTCPDLYFVLTDANGNAITSSTVDGTTSHTWSDLALPLTNPPYSIGFWDEDVVSASDHLGTYNIALSDPGNYPYSVAGGTNGQLQISLELMQQFNDTDHVHVLPLPEPLITEMPGTGELCVDATDMVQFAWLLDGDTVPGATSACVHPEAPGLWQAVVTNSYGCVGVSGPWVVCPEITIVQNGNVLSVPSGYASYTWSYNGTPIPDGDQAFIFIQGDGEYEVVIDGPNDCTMIASFTISTIGISELDVAQGHIGTYPVPNRGEFTVVAEGLSGSQARIQLKDMTGRTIMEATEAIINGTLRIAILTHASPGQYVVLVQAGGRSYQARTLIQ